MSTSYSQTRNAAIAVNGWMPNKKALRQLIVLISGLNLFIQEQKLNLDIKIGALSKIILAFAITLKMDFYSAF